MSKAPHANEPCMVAVWPGMGQVAINAGYYLMAKLGMHLEAELQARELFEIQHVEVEQGLIRTARLPRSRFFAGQIPASGRDLHVFLGEAQPPSGVYAYCRRIVDHAQALGVKRIITFAAMATQMSLEDKSRVFGAATDRDGLEECRRLGLEILSDAHISGLNGVLLGVAAERGVEGICLLGEMPHVFAQIPFPRASLEVLKKFTRMVDLEIDFSELERQTQLVDGKLQIMLNRIEEAVRGSSDSPGDESSFGPPLDQDQDDEKDVSLAAEDQARIEELFAQAAQDRAHAYRLKQELDRLKVFDRFEDRFLDLFREPKDGDGGGGREIPAA